MSRPLATQLLPLNPAESVLASFFDPEHALEIPYRLIGLGSAHARTGNTWCSTFLDWDDCAPGSDAARLEVDCDLPGGRWDRLILCMGVPDAVGWTVRLRADGVWHQAGSGAGTGRRDEIELPLPRGRLERIEATFTARSGGRQRVTLNWLGVADTALRQALRASRPIWDAAWPGLLRADADGIRFARGLLFNADDVPALRAKAASAGWRRHADALVASARQCAAGQPPEEAIDNHIPWSDERYIRAHERGRTPLTNAALEVGLAGLLTGDADLQRLAVRYLLSMCACGSWEPSDETHLRGSTWDQRCFTHELTATAVALLADWYDGMLTDRARSWVRKVLFDQGLAVIERDLMRHEYVHHINQGPWFCRALILGGLLLETSWPRVGGYADRAWTWMQEGMERYLQPDGGCDEGAGYLTLTLHAVLPAGIAYARARGRRPLDCLPRALAHTCGYAAAASAMQPGETVLDGDNASGWWFGDTVAIMAALQPEACWSGMLEPVLARRLADDDYYRPYATGSLSLVLGPSAVPPARCVVPEFAILPSTGWLSSLRRDGNRSLRLTLAGCKAHPSHSHRDKGSVTCEVDGVPMLVDPGQLRYDDLRVEAMPRTSLHNCLTPGEPPWADQGLAESAVIPQGLGDDRRLLARIDLAPVWHRQFAAIARELASDDLDGFSIRDRGERRSTGSVCLHLLARAPWCIGDRSATVTVAGRSLTAHAPWAVAITETEPWIDHRRERIHHLVITSAPLQTFDLTTMFRIGR